jgi:hypothetical protein
VPIGIERRSSEQWNILTLHNTSRIKKITRVTLGLQHTSMLFSVAEEQGFPLYRKFLSCRVRTADQSFHHPFRIFLKCMSVSAYSSMAEATDVFLLLVSAIIE